MSLKTFWNSIKEHVKSLWSKEPAAEKAVTSVISGINKAISGLNSTEADVILSIFPGGVAGHTVAEIKAIFPEALEVSTIANDALKETDGLTDPTEKANALITTVLGECAKLPELQKESHLLAIISSIVSKLLNISLTEATHLVTAKQQEQANEPAA